MPLSKRRKGESTEAEALPAGIVSRVQLSPYRVVLAGVATWRVDYTALSKELVASGLVEFNERAQKTVSARVGGRIDKLLVNETGQMVEEGDILAEIYSPDLLVTVQNLLQSLKSGNQNLVRDSQTRLELLGIDQAQIAEIVATGKAPTHLRIQSPLKGHVIQKYVREGQYVEEGMALYDIVDLSTVWIQAQVYEDDITLLPFAQDHPHVTDGEKTSVVATTRAFPNEEFRGTLKFIYPHVDQSTRTLTVRFEIENPEHKLRPGSTATVRLYIEPQLIESLKVGGMSHTQREELDNGRVLAVPSGSVIDTGDQKIVYRQSSPGEFEGVRVLLGPKMMDSSGVLFMPVVGGLRAGDQIVTSGSFLVDAETRLNPAAGSIYFGGSSGAKGGAGNTTIRATTPADPDAKITAELAKLSPEDRALAEKQRTCPTLAGSRLGSMGLPVKLLLDGETVFLCCSGCTAKAKASPSETAKRVRELRSKPDENDSPPPPPPGELVAKEKMPSSDDESAIAAALEKLPPNDRKLALAQQFCAVAVNNRLGSMGIPVKVTVKGEPLFLCCAGCEQAVKDNPDETLRYLKELRAKTRALAPTPSSIERPKDEAKEKKLLAEIAKLSPPDRALATAQRFCAVLEESRLGSMGPPIKLTLEGVPIFLCCKGCEQTAKSSPKATVARAEQLRTTYGANGKSEAVEGAKR